MKLGHKLFIILVETMKNLTFPFQYKHATEICNKTLTETLIDDVNSPPAAGPTEMNKTKVKNEIV